MKNVFLYIGLLIICLPKVGRAERLFTGHEADGSNQYYLQQRYYNPKIGRFGQIDPLLRSITQPGLPALKPQSLNANLLNPQNLNSYSYANNNPVNLIDSDGQLAESRQKRFDKISDYIRKDDNYWLVRDRDGNASAVDLLWQKSLNINNNNIGDALVTMFDAVNIDWHNQKTLDNNRQDYLDRVNNLPTGLSGEFGSDASKMDSLQHFFMSARLTRVYGARQADFLGRLHEAIDGFRAWRSGTANYMQIKAVDEGFSARDVINNRLGISWYLNLSQNKKTLPSEIINQYQQVIKTIWQGKPEQ